jgi:hypothetical protein
MGADMERKRFLFEKEPRNVSLAYCFPGVISRALRWSLEPRKEPLQTSRNEALSRELRQRVF